MCNILVSHILVTCILLHSAEVLSQEFQLQWAYLTHITETYSYGN